MRAFSLSILAAGLLANAGWAEVFGFEANLGPEAVGATGSGHVAVTFDTTAQTLFLQANWTGLSGVTTVAHIHCCTATAGTGTIGVAVTPGTLPGFPVGVSAGTYQNLLDLTDAGTYTAAFLNGPGGGTEAGASAALLQGLQDGKAYFNIHTIAYPGGEIRGFLQPVPEPGTWLLAGIALAGLLLGRRARPEA